MCFGGLLLFRKFVAFYAETVFQMHVAHRTRSRLDQIERENVERKKAEEEKYGSKIPVGYSRKNRQCERFLPICGPKSRRVSSSVSCNVEEQRSLDENDGAMVGREGGDAVDFGGSNNTGFEKMGTGVFGSERTDNVGSLAVGSADDDVVYLGEEEEGGTVDFDEVIQLLSESELETESVPVNDDDVNNSFGRQPGEGCGSVSLGEKCCSEGFLSRGSASFVFEGMENCTLTGTTELPVPCLLIGDERVVSSNVIDESDTLEMLTDGNSDSSSSDVADMGQYPEDCCSMEPRQSCNVDRDGEKGQEVEASQLRRKREKLIKAGLKRRKAYGLDILVREGSSSMNHNMDALLDLTQKEKSANRRTRSRYNLKKARKMSKFGTLVQPICIDDDLELSSVVGDGDGDDEMKLSYERDYSDANETGDRMAAWKIQLNNDVVYEYSDDDVVYEKEDIGDKKMKSSKRKCISYNANNDTNVQKYSGVHGDKNSILQKNMNRRKSENYGAVNIDHSDSHGNGYKTSFQQTKFIRRAGPFSTINTDVRDESENDYDKTSCGAKSRFNGTEACTHEMDNIAFAEKRHRKLKQGNRKRKKYTSCLKNYGVFKIHEDSICHELAVSSENLSNRDAGGNTPVLGPPIPLKFTFGIEESVPPEKSEVEKQLDELWMEMEFALGCTRVNYNHTAEDRNDSINFSEVGVESVDRGILCNRGNHELLIDEQIGYICKFCAYVGVEMKHIAASICKSQSSSCALSQCKYKSFDFPVNRAMFYLDMEDPYLRHMSVKNPADEML